MKLALSYYYQSFFKWYKHWQEDGFYSVRDAWLEKAYGMHQETTVVCGNQTYIGRFVGLDEHGALKLKTLNGHHTLQAGDVYFV